MIISQFNSNNHKASLIVKISAEQFAQTLGIQSNQETFKLLQIITNRLLTRTMKIHINKYLMQKINLTDNVLFNLKEKSIKITLSNTVKPYINSLAQDLQKKRICNHKPDNFSSRKKYPWLSMLVTKLRLIFSKL